MSVDEEYTEYSITSFRPTVISASGRNTGEFMVKYKFLRGHDFYESDQLVLKSYRNVEFNGKVIGSCPIAARVILIGCYVKFKTDHGIYRIKESKDHVLSLFLDNQEVGLIQRKPGGVRFIDNGSMKFPYQLALAWPLINIVHMS